MALLLLSAVEAAEGQLLHVPPSSPPSHPLHPSPPPQVRCCDGSTVWIGQLLHVPPEQSKSGPLNCTNAVSIKLPAAQV